MPKLILLTEDQWIEQFKPVTNNFVEDASWGGTMFETYGEELEHVLAQNRNNIWTYIDSENSDETLIIEGMHYVNRIGYFITEIPFNPEDNYEVRWN